MCNNHNRVYGKEAIYELISIELGRTKACDARIRYLSYQESKFEQYMVKQGKDYQSLKQHWLETDFINNQVVRDESLIDIMADRGDRIGQLDAEEDMAALLDAQMHDNVRRAYQKQYGIEGNCRFWEALLDKATDKVARLTKELKLQDRAQDYIDSLLAAGKRTNNRWDKVTFYKLVALKKVLDRRFKNKEIEYETWLIMGNQVHVALGWKLIPDNSKVPLVPDRITYFESKVKEFKAKVEEAHTAMFKEVEQKDDEISFHEVVAEGFQYATNEYQLQQVLEFIRDNK